MIIASPTKPASSPITLTLKRLIALLDEDETDDYGILQPTSAAFKLAMQWVIEAYDIMGDSFPQASVSTDDQGGIRMTWSKLGPDCQVRLVCPAAANQPPYLYRELGDNYAVEREITVSNLAQWLVWLKQIC